MSKWWDTGRHDTAKLGIDETIERIVRLNEGLRSFWSKSKGWAPLEAAQLMAKSRLDRQVSLSECLNVWKAKPSKGQLDGMLILGWANLGSLVEGTMKLFLSVFYKEYKADVDAIRDKRSNQLIDPDGLMLEPLKQFFQKKIWNTPEEKPWIHWIDKVQQRRNAIHAYKDRTIGTQDELIQEIKKYHEFLRFVNSSLPYPDDVYEPREY